jgi:hypothetical protein
MVKRLGAVTAILAMLIAMMGLGSVAAYHEFDDAVHPFADERFEDRWARTDQPVAAGEVDRTWIWGPSPYTPGMMELYLDSPGGQRLVQYFDKSRMELNDPDTEDTSIWVVTNGLLALDMLLGRIQIGDNQFVPHSEGPSHENVAGDPGPDNGPTYATMGTVMDEPARAEGTLITERIDREGTITTDGATAAFGVTAEHHVTQDWIDHTVASVFWDFMTATGTVWNGTAYAEEELFLNPFYATGYPVTEAYWTWVAVEGTEQWVLVQCFERRCLTYTPGNEEGWRVEAGNVGQHYYRWSATHVEPDVLNSRGIHVEPDGVAWVAWAGSGGDTCAMVGEGEDAFERCAGATGAVTVYVDGEHTVVASGLPSLTFFEDVVGPQDVFVTPDGAIYVVIGCGCHPDERALFGDAGTYLGWVVRINNDGSWTPIVDIAAYEAANNPDGGHIDSNPYSLVVTNDGMVVSDAGANALLWVDNEGNISTLAVFENRMVPAPPFLELPEGAEIPMESVPTGVALGPDGAYYVGELTGFPFVPGMARVWRVTAEGEATVVAEGFTNVIDVAFDTEGRLLVLEITSGGFLSVNPEDPTTLTGRLVRVEADGSHTTLLSEELVTPTGVDVDANGTIYVVNYSLVPGMESVYVFTPED